MVLSFLRSPKALALAMLCGFVPLSVAACSGAPSAPPEPPPTPPAPPPVETGARAEVAPAPPAPSATAAASAPPEPEKAAACPADMALVDGEYCTELELTCKKGKSRYAKQNKKTICSEFEAPTKCTGSKVKKRYCIDKYEFPNKKGERPEVMNDFRQAQKKCAALGKRVCTETEWTMACEGPSYKPYPYGYSRDANKCRGDRPYKFPDKQRNGMLMTHSPDKKRAQAELERLWDAVPSGSQPECVSDYGVHDMPGNADELASSETKAPRSKYDNVTTGGPWLDGVRNQCRPKIYDHNEGFSYYYLSFRCCAEADGKATDPRAPKQVERGDKWRP
jgi:formylglycine-generating enzyme